MECPQSDVRPAPGQAVSGWERTRWVAPLVAGVAIYAMHSLVLGSSGMPWENPLDAVAQSITGKAGASAATIGIAWTGINWGRGTEHGKEIFIGTTIGTGLIFGAAAMVTALGGNAGGVALAPGTGLPLGVFVSDALGEALGHLGYMSWLFLGLIRPLVWRKR